jgi:hypothetical protein
MWSKVIFGRNGFGSDTVVKVREVYLKQEVGLSFLKTKLPWRSCVIFEIPVSSFLLTNAKLVHRPRNLKDSSVTDSVRKIAIQPHLTHMYIRF